MYKLMAIDMDGTLLREDKTISEHTKETIQRAREKGVKVVLASGRPIEGLERYLEELHMTSEEDFVLSFNGSVLQKVKTKEVIFKNILCGKDLRELYELSLKLGVNIHAFSNKGCITPKVSEYSLVETRINDIPLHEVDFEEISDEEEIIKIMMIDPKEVLDQVIDQLPEELYERYTIVRSAPFFLEFLSKKSSKGTCVKALAEYLNIEPEEVICAGDAGNDLDMIQYAGLGVAMENAFEEVKAAANFITRSNEADGIAHVIEKFILED